MNCSIGIMAHNEAANAGALLDRLLSQRLSRARISEIIVVASGCTDGTEREVSARAARDARVILITEPRRRGKAAAINLFLERARCEICVLIGADTLPESDAVEQLTAPLADPAVGMSGARIVPLNSKDTFPGYAVHFLWDMHHRLALRRPKCGEAVAFRRVFDRIPETTVVDEPQIEALVHAAGLRTVYAHDAVVYNLGPDTAREILMRRRSIVAGYIELSRRTPYRTATQARLAVLAAALRNILTGREPALYAFGALSLEAAARVLGFLDFHLGRAPRHIWPMAPSTKRPADFIEPQAASTQTSAPAPRNTPVSNRV